MRAHELAAAAPWLRHLPNLISGGRLLAAPVMIALMFAHAETAFCWLLIAALASDAVDGLIARALAVQSRIGAMLDSAADVTTLLSAALGVAAFHAELFRDHGLACAAILAGWVLVGAVSVRRYGRLSSFHTYASKAAGYALGFFVATLFLVGFSPPLFFLAVFLSLASNAEELALLAVLPQWRSDVRGIWWVTRERQADNGPAAEIAGTDDPGA